MDYEKGLTYFELCKKCAENGIFVTGQNYKTLYSILCKINPYCIDVNLSNQIITQYNKKIYISKIKQIQKWWRTAHPKINYELASINDVDPFSMEKIKDINKDYKFQFYEDGKLFIFDVRYLHKLLKSENKLVNPYTGEQFDEQTLNRINDKLEGLKKADIELELDEEIITYSVYKKRELENICCIINRLGFSHFTSEWMSLTYFEMIAFYLKMAFMWNNPSFSGIRQSFGKELFGNIYLIKYIDISNTDTLSRMIISELKKMFIGSHDDDMKIQLVIYLLLGLYGIKEDISLYYGNVLSDIL